MNSKAMVIPTLGLSKMESRMEMELSTGSSTIKCISESGMGGSLTALVSISVKIVTRAIF